MPVDNLSKADVAKLLSDPTPDNRAATAAKVAGAFDPGKLSPTERALAEEIFRLMVKDAEVRVRQALTENLKQNGNVPHDVAVALANDIDQVALPMIEFSQVLNGVQSAMVNRASLPVTVAERLVALVSENLRDELVKRHELPAAMTTDIILQSRERATISLSSDSSVDDVMILARQLNDNGRLTPSITLRALCMGDITFFECAMATRAGVTLDNARRLIHDRGPLGLRAIFDKARLPPAQFMAVRAALDVSRETQMDGGENDRERYARRMIERIMTQYDDLGVEFESSDLRNRSSDFHTLAKSLSCFAVSRATSSQALDNFPRISRGQRRTVTPSLVRFRRARYCEASPSARPWRTLSPHTARSCERCTGLRASQRPLLTTSASSVAG